MRSCYQPRIDPLEDRRLLAAGITASAPVKRPVVADVPAVVLLAEPGAAYRAPWEGGSQGRPRTGQSLTLAVVGETQPGVVTARLVGTTPPTPYPPDPVGESWVFQYALEAAVGSMPTAILGRAR